MAAVAVHGQDAKAMTVRLMFVVHGRWETYLYRAWQQHPRQCHFFLTVDTHCFSQKNRARNSEKCSIDQMRVFE